ncbi:MAG: protein phosphatase 2C domain-containing protein [Verrucomicrobiae bacterium]|nr:protein phosphatase 2C domain-containing protein [Verrucomicrobiae bacterium]
MKLSCSGLSVAGRPAPNQDCVGFWQEETGEGGAVAVVADGVGGLWAGELASRLAVETALKAFGESPWDMPLRQRLLELFRAANDAVYRKGLEPGSPGPMATTLAAAVFGGREMAVGNVGDSRVYLVHRGLITQLSVDHSVVGLQRRFGHITETQLRSSPHRNLITRGVGVAPSVEVDMDQVPVFAGDRVVLCSDGLYGCVADAEIVRAVETLTPEAACRQLVALAVGRGADDDVSVQVVEVIEV